MARFKPNAGSRGGTRPPFPHKSPHQPPRVHGMLARLSHLTYCANVNALPGVLEDRAPPRAGPRATSTTTARRLSSASPSHWVRARRGPSSPHLQRVCVAQPSKADRLPALGPRHLLSVRPFAAFAFFVANPVSSPHPVNPVHPVQTPTPGAIKRHAPLNQLQSTSGTNR